MNTARDNLAGALLFVIMALGTSWGQNASQELHLSDLRTQQPQGAILTSSACQRAREEPRGRLASHERIDPKTLAPDLGTLMKESDEVIVAAPLEHQSLLSPSGESVATYFDVRVIHRWKGSHHPGDVMTFGMPDGFIHCEAPPWPKGSYFWAVPGQSAEDWKWPETGPYVYLLFLRRSIGDETKLVQGLRPVTGEGVQGLFAIRVPAPVLTDQEKYCAGVPDGRVEHCEAYLQTSQSPVVVPYAHDPLAKKYGGMPASEFLREVQSAASVQGVAEKSSQ